MTVLILHDAITDASRPDEQDALVQAREVAAALSSLGHRTRIRPVDLNLAALAAALRDERPDAVFNLVESLDRQGRLIHLVPAVLDSLAIPYTGTTTIPMLNTSSKLVAKRMLTAGGIATPPWRQPGRNDSTLQPPCRCIVKSVWEEASVGIDDASIIDTVSTRQLDAIIAARAPQLGGEAFAEAFIEGREFNLSLLAAAPGERPVGAPILLPPAEIDFIDFPAGKPRIVGYAAKWDDRSHEFHHTPRRFDFPDGDTPLLANLSRIAVDCWNLFDLAGYARVDFRVDSAGRPWVLEINANPCLSADAGFMAAAGQAGLSLTDVVERLLSAAVGTAAARPVAG
ncbi:MAG: D-alanine--D-alanine ligase [Planctomycetota bacterium]